MEECRWSKSNDVNLLFYLFIYLFKRIFIQVYHVRNVHNYSSVIDMLPD